VTTTDSFFLRPPLRGAAASRPPHAAVSFLDAGATPDQRFARAIERAGHGRTWPYLVVLPEIVSVRTIRAVVERHGFARERITTTCTSAGDRLAFASPDARGKHELVRFDRERVAARSAVERGALEAAAAALQTPPRTAIRVAPTDRGAERLHQIVATIAREGGGVVVKWSGRTGDCDAFDVLRP